jgi:F1F0 ATPase subunit 2
MSEQVPYILVFFFGLSLGLVYFGGLWWTITRLRVSKKPLLLSLVSFWARILTMGIGFYHVARMGSWIYVMMCLAGFVLTRLILVRRLGPREIDTGRS